MPDPPTSPEPIPFKPARSGCCRYNVPILVLIHLGVIGHFPMLFACRVPHLEAEVGAGRLQILAFGLISFSPNLDWYLCRVPHTRFSSCLFLHPEIPASVTSPLHLQTWDQRYQVGGTTFCRPVVCFVAAAYIWF